MAVIKKENAYMEFPLQISRQYGAPVDKYSIFYSLVDATTYATTSPLAYVGQTITVVDEANSKATSYVIQDLAGNLKEVGSGSAAPMLFVADEAAMLALTDIQAGQQVYREDTHTVWIYKGSDPSQVGNWVESASQNDLVWQGTTDKVGMYALTQSAYDAIESKSDAALYVITDRGKIYKGTVDITSSVIASTTVPEVTSAVIGKLYINSSTLEMKLTNDGVNWIVTSPGYLTDASDWNSADGSKLATIGLIKKAITQVDTTAVFTSSTGVIKVGTGTGAALNTVAHAPSYDAANLKLTIPVYGGDDIVVNIPKDKFVTTGKYYEDYPEAPATATHHKVIVLTIDNQEEPVIIPAESLVNIYTADNSAATNVSMTISEDNKVSAAFTVDAGDGSGKLVTIDETGHILSSADMTILQDTGTTELGTATNQIPTSSIIARAIAAAINAYQPDLSSKMNKLAEGEVDRVIISAENGQVTRSAASIGTAQISEAPTDKTLATEAAVAAAISWKSIL